MFATHTAGLEVVTDQNVMSGFRVCRAEGLGFTLKGASSGSGYKALGT